MKKIYLYAIVIFVLLIGCNQNSQKDGEKPEKNFYDLKKITPYLYEVSFDNFRTTFNGEDMDSTFSCSSIRNGNFFGRNFDFIFNDCPSFIVHVKANKKHHGFVGVSTHFQVFKDKVFADENIRHLNLLPSVILDGINDCGVICSCNVVIEKLSEFKQSNPSSDEKVYQLNVVSYILQHATSADNAVELLKKVNVCGKVVGDINLHYMIADKDKTYIAELIDETVDIAEKNGNEQIMTNFYCNRGLDVQQKPDGLERYDILQQHYEDATTDASVRGIMELVKYSNTYREGNKWYSESGFPKSYWEDQSSDEFKELLESRAELNTEYWNARNNNIRDGKNHSFWWTVHSSVYNIEEKILKVIVQEEFDNVYEFKLIE